MDVIGTERERVDFRALVRRRPGTSGGVPLAAGLVTCAATMGPCSHRRTYRRHGGQPDRLTSDPSSCRRRQGVASSRHYQASLLIASGADVKVVQTRLHHASASTLNTCAHLWPDSDETTRTAVGAVPVVSRGMYC